MTSGLHAPLSPQEAIALRRIAHGSLVVDAAAASSLVARALIERKSDGLRLTPLGRLRFEALPKAPLLTRQRSIHAMNGYVEGLIDKAQTRAANPGSSAGPPRSVSQRVPDAIRLPSEAIDAETDQDDGPIHFFFDIEYWTSRAERHLARTRRVMMEHRKVQVSLCDSSRRRIEFSRALLKASVPLRPISLDAAGCERP